MARASKVTTWHRAESVANELMGDHGADVPGPLSAFVHPKDHDTVRLIIAQRVETELVRVESEVRMITKAVTG